uniref:Uncharacterized protein n=1 Tax=Ostreococcus mediterraneus TaxID=1486918 RepID=A0A6U0F4M9_9CHLO|mmetsp:Transcript_8370/g.31130  ORF Transcript_8370/g.31130 Transcript_8370/m.31130 type:complete len:558 (+) Transcript_8370:98-1771(+)
MPPRRRGTTGTKGGKEAWMDDDVDAANEVADARFAEVDKAYIGLVGSDDDDDDDDEDNEEALMDVTDDEDDDDEDEDAGGEARREGADAGASGRDGARAARDEAEARAVIEATVSRLKDRQANKVAAASSGATAASRATKRASATGAKKTVRKSEWDSFVDWKTMEHQEYETLSDAEYAKLTKKLALEPEWRPMVSYLTSLGLKAGDLEKMLINCEEVFNRPVSRVITRVEYLQSEVGLEGKTLRQIVNKDPRILLQRNRHSIPRCRYLTKIGVPQDKLADVLGKQPSILHLSVQKGLMPRVQYLKQEVGIAAEDIPLVIQRSPAVLTFSVENQIQPRVEFLRELGISKENVVKMITRHPHLLQYSFEGLGEHLKFLGEIGMNDNEVALTVTRLSQFFSLSVENSLRPKYEYLTGELGGTKETCVKYPAYFSLSLDQRIKPRHLFLEQYDLAPDPFPMKYLSVKDEEFVLRADRTVAEFEEYKEEMIPIFTAETARRALLRQVTTSSEEQRMELERKRAEYMRTHQELARKREYSDRVLKARNSHRMLLRVSNRRSR